MNAFVDDCAYVLKPFRTIANAQYRDAANGCRFIIGIGQYNATLAGVTT